MRELSKQDLPRRPSPVAMPPAFVQAILLLIGAIALVLLIGQVTAPNWQVADAGLAAVQSLA